MSTERNGETPPAGVAALVRGMSRRVGGECMSDLQLDQLALGELQGLVHDRAKLHLAQCSACDEASRRVLQERKRFFEETDFAQVSARLLQRVQPQGGLLRRWLRVLALPAGLSAAAALALVMMAGPLHTVMPRSAEGVRTKGAGFAVSTYVKFAGQEQPGTLYMGQPLTSGDRLQFRVDVPHAGYLGIFAMDARGEVSVFYPPGDQLLPVKPGRDQALGTAVELDDSPGTETVLALLCEKPAAVAALRTTLMEAAVDGGEGTTRLGPLRVPCAEIRTTLSKLLPGSPR